MKCFSLYLCNVFYIQKQLKVKMSQINNSMKNNNSNKKPFCKVCKDAGKTEKDYSSHYLKNRDGEVICPTLLNQECRFCGEKGHTTSYCDKKKQQFEQKEKEKAAIASLPSAKTSGSWANKLVTGKCDPKILNEIQKADDEAAKRIQDAVIKEREDQKKAYEARKAAKQARIEAKFNEELDKIKRKNPVNWQWIVEGTEYDIEEARHFREDSEIQEQKEEEEWNKTYDSERIIIKSTMTDEEWENYEREGDEIWSDDPNGYALLHNHSRAFREAKQKICSCSL